MSGEKSGRTREQGEEREGGDGAVEVSDRGVDDGMEEGGSDVSLVSL